MESDHMTGDELEVEVGTLDDMASTSMVDRAQLDSAVATANRYPRSITKAIEEAHTMALMTEEIAESMFYVLPRSDKDIIGPSARLAEIMVYAWRNLRVEAETIAEDRTHVTARGTCFDMERNTAVRISVKRRITKANGKRYSDDMIIVTSNAAVSIALRNAVFRVIPRAYTDQVYRAAMKASVGDTETIAAKREVALSWFGERDIKPEQVYELLKVHGIDDIGVEEIIRLRGIVNAVKDSETTIDAIFNPETESDATRRLDDALAPDALEGAVPSGKYRGLSYRDLLGEDDGPDYIRRYILPRAIGDLREQLEAVLNDEKGTAGDEEEGGATATSSSNAPDAGEMPREEAGTLGGARAADPPPEDSGWAHFDQAREGGKTLEEAKALVQEVWQKVTTKSAKLVEEGLDFSFEESEHIDELRDAGNLDELLEIDEMFARRLL